MFFEGDRRGVRRLCNYIDVLLNIFSLVHFF